VYPVVKSDVDAGRFIVTFAVLLGVLCIDNFCIWCGAALLRGNLLMSCSLG